MKKVLLLLIVLAAGIFSVNAQDEGRLVISAGQLKKIAFGEGMKVVLVSAESFNKEVKGDMQVFEKLNISVVDGTMRIQPNSKLAHNETVFVVVNQLQMLTLGQNTKVSTEGILRSSKGIDVYVQHGAIARLITTAKVNAYSADNYEILVERNPIAQRAFSKL
jgi:Putative auto-transporter adhesin, head GIN domain